MGISLYDDLLEGLRPKRQGLYDDLVPPEPPKPKPFWRDVLDFQEAGDVAKGLVRAGSGMLHAAGEGTARLLGSAAERAGLQGPAAGLRGAAEYQREAREGLASALPYQHPAIGIPAQIVGNIGANIAAGDVGGSIAAASSPEYSSVGLAAELLKGGEPGPVRRTLARGAEQVAESPLGRALTEYGLSRLTGGLVRKGLQARQAAKARQAAANYEDLLRDTRPITDPRRLLGAAPEEGVQGPAIPMRGDVEPGRPMLQSIGREATEPVVDVPSANTQAVRDFEAELRAASARRADPVDRRPLREILREQSGHVYSNPVGPALRESLRSRGTAAGVGAAAGALSDEENRLRGAAIGAAAGLAAQQAARMVGAARTSGQAMRGRIFADVPAGPAGKVDITSATGDGAEKLVAAAVRTKDGRTFQGPIHMLAVQAAEKAGVAADDIDPDWGYLTSTGRFLNRTEAQAIDGNVGHGRAGVVQVRPGTYRDEPGFKISGTDPRGRRVSIFARTRESAEHIRTKVLAGQDIDVADFADPPPTGPGTAYSNPLLSPSLITRALSSREGRGAAIAGAGIGLRESEDERLAATGNGLILLGLAHGIGVQRITRGAKAATRPLVAALSESPLGRKALNAISYDILAKPDVKAAVAAFEEEVGKGGARAAKVTRATQGLSPSLQRAVSDVIEGEAFEAATRTLSPQDARLVAGIARQISDEFTELGRAKVGAGLLSKETVAKREGRYLPRLYAQFFGAQGENVPDVITAGGRKVRIRGDKARIDELPAQVRNKLGEIREAGFRAAYGLEKGYRDVASAKLFTALKGMPDVLHPEYSAAVDAVLQAQQAGDRAALTAARAQLTATTARLAKTEGFTRLPDTPAMGVLRNAVVRQDVADYLNGVPNLSGAFGKAMSFWKRIHTVGNPGTHVGNFMSNTVKYHMAGMPLTDQPRWLLRAKQGLQSFDADVRFLAERGGINKNYATAGEAVPLGGKSTTRTLRELAGTTRPETKAALETRGVKPYTTAQKVALGVKDRVERAYAWEDNVFAVALFKRLKASGVQPEEAARRIADLNDFSTRSPLLGKVRDLASPFVLFTAKEAPRLFANIVEHPVRWMMLAAIWGGMDQFSRRAVGAVEERELRPDQRVNRALGYLSPGTIQLPFAGPRGEKVVSDIGRWTPLSAFTGGPAPGAVGTQLSDRIPPILNPSGPIIDAGAALANVDAFTGEKLLTPGMTTGERVGKLAQTAGKFVLPSAASFHVPRVVGDLRRGDTQAARTDALGLIGARPSYVQPGLQQLREQRKYEEALTAIRSDLRRDLLRAKSEPARQRATEKAQRRLQDLVKRLPGGGGSEP